jgi:hypothetical protein
MASDLKLPVIDADEDALLPSKGWYDAVVEQDGVQYQISFRALANLQQDLEASVQTGGCFTTVPGVVVLAQVNAANLRRALEALADGDWFDGLAPL